MLLKDCSQSAEHDPTRPDHVQPRVLVKVFLLMTTVVDKPDEFMVSISNKIMR